MSKNIVDAAASIKDGPIADVKDAQSIPKILVNALRNNRNIEDVVEDIVNANAKKDPVTKAIINTFRAGGTKFDILEAAIFAEANGQEDITQKIYKTIRARSNEDGVKVQLVKKFFHDLTFDTLHNTKIYSRQEGYQCKELLVGIGRAHEGVEEIKNAYETYIKEYDKVRSDVIRNRGVNTPLDEAYKEYMSASAALSGDNDNEFLQEAKHVAETHWQSMIEDAVQSRQEAKDAFTVYSDSLTLFNNSLTSPDLVLQNLLQFLPVSSVATTLSDDVRAYSISLASETAVVNNIPAIQDTIKIITQAQTELAGLHTGIPRDMEHLVYVIAQKSSVPGIQRSAEEALRIQDPLHPHLPPEEDSTPRSMIYAAGEVASHRYVRETIKEVYITGGTPGEKLKKILKEIAPSVAGGYEESQRVRSTKESVLSATINSMPERPQFDEIFTEENIKAYNKAVKLGKIRGDKLAEMKIVGVNTLEGEA